MTSWETAVRMLTVERDGVIVTRPAPIRLRCRCCMGSIPSTRALCSGTATAEVQVRGTDAVRCALRTCCKCVSCMTCHRTWAWPKVRHIPLPVSPCSSGAQSGRRSTPSFSPQRRSSNVLPQPQQSWQARWTVRKWLQAGHGVKEIGSSTNRSNGRAWCLC